MLAGVECFDGRDEAQVERARIGQLVLEGARPPLERLAWHRGRAELRRELLVEDDTAAVGHHAEPRAGQLLEALAADPQDRILRDAVLLGLLRLLGELGIALERPVLEAGLAEQLVVVHERPHGGEVGQAPRLAVTLRDGARERREVLDVLLHARQAVDRLRDALLDVAREVLHRRLRDVDRLVGREHGRELGHLRLHVGLDDLLHLHGPVVLELLRDLLVDLAVLPDHEVHGPGITGRALAPRSGLLREAGAGKERGGGGGGQELAAIPACGHGVLRTGGYARWRDDTRGRRAALDSMVPSCVPYYSWPSLAQP